MDEKEEKEAVRRPDSTNKAPINTLNALYAFGIQIAQKRRVLQIQSLIM
jgi:hypothetical protein